MRKSSRKRRRKSWKAPGSATSNALFTFSFLSRRSLYAPVLPELPLQLRAAKNSEFWQMSGCCRPWRRMGWAWHLREVWDGSLPHSNHSTPERGTKSPSGGSAWRLLAMWRWQSAAMSTTKIRGCYFPTLTVIIHIHLKYRYILFKLPQSTFGIDHRHKMSACPCLVNFSLLQIVFCPVFQRFELSSL